MFQTKNKTGKLESKTRNNRHMFDMTGTITQKNYNKKTLHLWDVRLQLQVSITFLLFYCLKQPSKHFN